MKRNYDNLKEEAIALGACAKGIDSWGEPNLTDLCEKFFKFQDFCIEHDWPTVEQLAAFDKRTLRRNGIYVNGKCKCNGLAHVVVTGDAEVEVHVTRPCDITLRHKGIANVYIDTDVLCTVSMYDNSRLNVIAKHQKGRVAISHWGGVIQSNQLIDKIYAKTK